MKYKISIIIPIHNVEVYIEECLDSIVNQTFKLEDIQVIMVNDGSTDSSGKIIDRYAKKHPNFIAVHLPRAHGVAGTARNEGLKIAEGEYLMFADPDDFYDVKACEVMYDCITKTKTDMVTANYKNTNIEGKKWKDPVFDKKSFKSFKLETRQKECAKSFFVLCSAVWVKIFRRDFIEKHQIRFLEGVPAEDAYFTYSTFLNSDNIYYLSDVIYYYRQRNMDFDTKSISWNCSERYFRQVNEAYIEIYKLFEKANRLDAYRYLYSKNLTYILYKFIDSGNISDEDRKRILEMMHWFYAKGDMLSVEPVQGSLKILVNKIVREEYAEALDICKIIQELRTYLSEKVKQNMSKPKEILYKKISKEEVECSN